MHTLIALALTWIIAQQNPPLSLEQIRIRDPFILPVASTKTYYLYGTGRPLGEPGFDMYKSKDLNVWEGPFPVFRPEKDYWGQRDFWAPEVHVYQGRYYMFCTFSPQEGCCRGTAILVADTPEGPFSRHSPGPLTPADWMALDGTLFVDDKTQPWMVFCHEWEQIQDGAICAVRLSMDLKQAEGEPIALFHASDAAWAGTMGFGDKSGLITDGPWLYRSPDGALRMLWSSFGKERNYCLGSARSASGNLTGPWTVDAAPILSSDGGHAMMFTNFNGVRMLALHQPNQSPNERAKLFKAILNGNVVVLATY